MRVTSIVRLSLSAIAFVLLQGCASLSGYPDDPVNTDADLAALKAAAGSDALSAYLKETDPTQRQSMRDQIVYARLAAYDLEFQNFQAALFRESSLQNLSGDLVVLALNGVGATTGGAATKTAMAAASEGVVGANAHINKDVFFDQTFPAISAQMSASRSAQLTIIEAGLKQPDALYPLTNALMDLSKYREAGSIPSAVRTLTANVTSTNTDIKAAQERQKFARAPAPFPRITAFSLSRRAAPTSAVTLPPQDLSLYRNLP